MRSLRRYDNDGQMVSPKQINCFWAVVRCAPIQPQENSGLLDWLGQTRSSVPSEPRSEEPGPKIESVLCHIASLNGGKPEDVWAA